MTGKMVWKDQWKGFAGLAAVFLALFYLPVGTDRFDGAVLEGLQLAKWYAREHVVFCLVPAFFIAGAIAVFVSQTSVMRYLGPRANRLLAYGVASVSGTTLAVCSCTVLPLFAGIYRMGAGLGPATAFLYSGPAINVLAIILTARVLGLELGVARAVGAVAFSLVIGLLMHLIFRKQELARETVEPALRGSEPARPLWQNAIFFGILVAILVFANWSRPAEDSGFWSGVYAAKWLLTAAGGVLLAIVLAAWLGVPWRRMGVAALPVALLAFLFPGRPVIPFAAGVVALSVVTSTRKGEPGDWFAASWGFARQILPLLFIGVLVSGFLLGRPGREGVIPSDWVGVAVGGNSMRANLLAAVVGAFMYFATLTEVPILQGLLGAGMGRGPALALLLAGPALSLPNMLVIRSVMGTRKTAVYISLVIVMATITGIAYGTLCSLGGSG